VEESQRRVCQLMEALAVLPEHLVAGSYSDLLAATGR
jgi:hypothetical protein